MPKSLQDQPLHVPEQEQAPDLCLQALYRATDPEDFFHLYTEALLQDYSTSNNPNSLREAGFVRKYAAQIENPKFKKASKNVHATLSKFPQELDPKLKADVEGRCKATISTINKGKKKINHLEEILDIFAFRVVLYGPFDEPRLISFCYQYLNTVCKYFLSLGYLPCKASPVSDIIDKESEAYKQLVHPSQSDVDSIKWIGPQYVKDYIESPKKNTYSRIHVAFTAPDGYTFELQICTLASHARAEEGDSIDTTGTLDHDTYKRETYPDGVVCDPTRINMPGFTAVIDPKTGDIVLHDLIGLMVPKKITAGQ